LSGFGIAYRTIDRQLLIAAAKLRREHGVKTPDAIHVASALAAGATLFATNDDKLLKKKIPGLQIVQISGFMRQLEPYLVK